MWYLPGKWPPVGGKAPKGVLAHVDAFELRDLQQGGFEHGAGASGGGVKLGMDFGVFGILVLTLETVGLKRRHAVNEFDQVVWTLASQHWGPGRNASELLRRQLPGRYFSG